MRRGTKEMKPPQNHFIIIRAISSKNCCVQFYSIMNMKSTEPKNELMRTSLVFFLVSFLLLLCCVCPVHMSESTFFLTSFAATHSFLALEHELFPMKPIVTVHSLLKSGFFLLNHVRRVSFLDRIYAPAPANNIIINLLSN